MRIPVDTVKVVEVGPRDGLQNEKVTIPTDAKVEFITALADAGLRVIEAGAFVSPKWVPQMADTGDVYAQIPKDPGVDYPVLVPNAKGLDRAIDAGVKSIAIFTAASDTFNKRNINMSIDESFENYKAVAARARSENLRMRGYVSTAFGCPYEGDVPAEKVLEVSARLLDLGCDDGLWTRKLADAVGADEMHGVEIVDDQHQRSARGNRLDERLDFCGQRSLGGADDRGRAHRRQRTERRDEADRQGEVRCNALAFGRRAGM